jgi:hypothetical protein
MPFPATLNPGDQMIVPFSFTPMMPIESRGNFVMVTDDPVFPERHVLVEGSAQEYADIFVQPTSIDFGALRPGCSSGARSIRIFNAGTMDGAVDGVTLTSTDAEFLLSAVPPIPLTVPAGGSSGFNVAYQPNRIGAADSAIEIDVRDHPYPIIVPMQGAGTNTPQVTDQFQQMANDQVDVLFIMGNTDAMADLQPGLVANLHTFIEQTSLRQIDFHIGVTSTNILPVAGLLVGPVITRSTSNVIMQFETEADIQAVGDDDEESLEAMAGAFRLAQNGVQPNASLFRSTARLVVVIITDDDDTSPLTPVSYFSELRSHAPRGFLVAVISGEAAGCGDQDMGTIAGGAEAAPKLEAFVQLTKGISASECADWSTTLSMIGAASFGLDSRFFLSKSADTTMPIVVKIDGVVQPATNWSYDPSTSSITFTSPPQEGSTITVDYVPTC